MEKKQLPSPKVVSDTDERKFFVSGLSPFNGDYN